MRCPYCGCTESQVKDTRAAEENTAIRRRRICANCYGKFTTLERIQLREIIVVKRDGGKEPLIRDKITNSMLMALRKRRFSHDQLDFIVSGIIKKIETKGEVEIPSQDIGSMVIDELKQLDDIAYVRFASVYRDFREVKDFEQVLGELSGGDKTD